MYELEFLPLARQDMVEAVRYIAHKLGNPIAAERLTEELRREWDRIAENPYLYPAYTAVRPLAHEYRRASVRNYSMFFRVDESAKLVTVARVVYARRDLDRILDDRRDV